MPPLPAQSLSRADRTPEERIADNTDVLRRMEVGRGIGTILALVLIYFALRAYFS
jgi:hypothetical protein